MRGKFASVIFISLLTLFIAFILNNSSRTSQNTKAQTTSCSLKSNGDANCDGQITLADFEVWRKEYTGVLSTKAADTNSDGIVNLVDFEKWRKAFTQSNPNPTQPPGNNLTSCDRNNGPFSLTINNPYMPFTVGTVRTLANDIESVRITVLNQTKVVDGVTTRVVEEYEQANGQLVEISKNYFAQAPDGAVCYFGEDVDIYQNGQVVSHDGTWLAGGQNKAGIIMPANPTQGMTFQIESAPGIAQETGTVAAVGTTVVTPSGTFTDTVYIQENNGTEISHKYYARGIGMVDDDGMKQISGSGTSPTPTTGAGVPTPTTGVPSPTGPGSTVPTPPPGEFPNEQIIQFNSLPANIKSIVDQRHPTKTVKEVKKETYSNGAIVYAIELIIDGHQWDMGILSDGTVLRDEYEIVP